MKIKQLAPIYYRYLRAETKNGLSWKGATGIAVVSFLYSLLNGLLTTLVVNGAPFTSKFLVAIIFFVFMLFSIRVMAYAKTAGMIILILFSALGYAVGTEIF